MEAMAEMQKDNFLNQHKSYLRQNSVKGPKDSNSPIKKKEHKLPKCAKKCHQKTRNRDITPFLDKTAWLGRLRS